MPIPPPTLITYASIAKHPPPSPHPRAYISATVAILLMDKSKRRLKVFFSTTPSIQGSQQKKSIIIIAYNSINVVINPHTHSNTSPSLNSDQIIAPN